MLECHSYYGVGGHTQGYMCDYLRLLYFMRVLDILYSSVFSVTGPTFEFLFQ